MKRKLISIALCLCMAVSLLPSTALAEDGINYLALGDSISTGYGLVSEGDGFASLIAAANGFTLTNRAQNGNTAIGILAQFLDGSLNADIAAADIITITCGGNDLMAVLYAAIAEDYNTTAEEPISAENVTELMASGGISAMGLLTSAQRVLNGSEEDGVPKFVESDALAVALGDFIHNLGLVIEYIRSHNADAAIVITTQYNPYASFSGLYSVLNTEIGKGAEMLSAAIVEYAGTAGCIVADVHAAFAAANENLCNATTSPMNLDFHPNAAGHALIAAVVQEALEAESAVTVISFSDVVDPDTQWFYDEVYAAANAGIIAGNTDGTFNPDGGLTWAQTITFAVRLAQLNAGERIYGSADQVGTWYQIYFDYALANGIITSAPANPDGEILRGDAAVIFAAVLGDAEQVNNVADGYFTDVAAGSAAYDAVYALSRAGITNGVGGGEFGVNKNFKRSEIAAIVSRMAGLVDLALIGA